MKATLKSCLTLAMFYSREVVECNQMKDDRVSGWAHSFVSDEPKNVTPRHDSRWLHDMVESLHAEQRAQAAKKQHEANICGLVFLLLFGVLFVPAPPAVHWVAFFIGIACGARAYGCWSRAQTLRHLATMNPPPDF
jgi:hypothetical protein